MQNGLARFAILTALVFSVLLLGGCAKSISVSPQEVTLSAAQPSAQVTVTMKYPYTVWWSFHSTNYAGLLVSPGQSQDKTTQVSVTATDFSGVPRNEKVTFFIETGDYPEAVLTVHVQ